MNHRTLVPVRRVLTLAIWMLVAVAVVADSPIAAAQSGGSDQPSMAAGSESAGGSPNTAAPTGPGGATGAAPGGRPAAPNASAFFLPAMMIALVAFMLLTSRSQKKKEKRERDELHAGMSKNDRVLTVGGIVGTIHTVRENEVVLKVDESTNTKMTFLKTAIQRTIQDDQDISG